MALRIYMSGPVDPVKGKPVVEEPDARNIRIERGRFAFDVPRRGLPAKTKTYLPGLIEAFRIGPSMDRLGDRRHFGQRTHLEDGPLDAVAT